MTEHTAESEVPPWDGELDQGAMHLAHLAHMETQGTGHDKTVAAVRGYLFGVSNRKPFGTSGDFFVYPSLNDLRAMLASVAQPTQEDA